jgi:hypothetical protein
VPVEQPSLQGGSAPSILESNSAPSSTAAPSAHWQFQKPADSTALIPPREAETPAKSEQETPARPAPSVLENDNFTRAEPIQAPADYVAPYRPHSYQAPRIVPVNQPASGLDNLQAPLHSQERLAAGTSTLTSVSAPIAPLPATLPGRVLDLRQRRPSDVAPSSGR